MKLKLLTSIAIISISFSIRANAQNNRQDKLYTVSGVGFAIPVGETADYLTPKFSSSIGLNFGIGKGGLFLYPKVSLHAFGFNQITPDAGYTYTVQKGRATTYLLNVALGYRKIVNKWAFYGFAGAGGGIILTSQAAVNTSTLQVNMDNKSNSMGIIEAGAGLEYNIGGANLFAEADYMYGLSKIQNRSFNTVPISVGVKTNLSKLFNKK
ncbi:autotransporter outer membrane beta-barrel domain-containing protein [Pedobacter changchengzhani]|uniref:Autotransporter outer membrane beta-barrel domain-containing protein n=1 Tax=Pedobacter changchengzhani TaxID=2529274 RepID=A0A4V3A065_9SPHI|nr:autotransporter outer membrane beta-barrel domain-containing protein [Pedobacter changchengzhani]TDG36053.1 autotransporter outer membrane beta-barrel domain-containing protein [Pedobacter changchengzhani]